MTQFYSKCVDYLQKRYTFLFHDFLFRHDVNFNTAHYPFSTYAPYSTLSDYQNVLTFTFFILKKLDGTLFSFKWLCKFDELIVFMGIWQLNVHDYIFKVLITAIMELRTVGLG